MFSLFPASWTVIPPFTPWFPASHIHVDLCPTCLYPTASRRVYPPLLYVYVWLYNTTCFQTLTVTANHASLFTCNWLLNTCSLVIIIMYVVPWNFSSKILLIDPSLFNLTGEIQELVLGMPHRGRLNLLTGLLKYPAAQMFSKVCTLKFGCNF